MPHHKLHRRISCKPRCRRIISILLRQSQTAGQTGIFRPPCRRQSNDCIFQAPAEDGRHSKRQNHPGKSQAHIRRPHQDRLCRTALFRTEKADAGPGHRNRRRCRQGSKDPGLHPDHHAGQHIPSQPVRSGRVQEIRRRQHGKALCIRVIGAELLRKGRRQQKQRRHRQKDVQFPFHSHSSKPGGSFHDFRPPVRSRGSRRRHARSAARLMHT